MATIEAPPVRPALFNVDPKQRFAGQSSAIRRPREIACFSYDEKHEFRLDDSSVRYYYPPRLPADLSAGFDSFRQLDDTADDHLDGLLRAIVELERRTGQQCEADVITWRGMMTKIMAVPYDFLNGFTMRATHFQGTIFIEEDHAAKLAERKSQSARPSRPGEPSQDLMMYWGYKFETLALLPDKWDAVSREQIEDRESEVVSNHMQYCSVVRTGIGNTTLVIGGEVDALWDRKPDDSEAPINWVELKTAKEISSEKDQLTFERKLLKFWIQSFLLGVPKIVVGFRNQNGVLERLRDLETQKIPGEVKRYGLNTWDGNLCINFTAAFLHFLKNTITGDGVWRIRRAAKSPVIEVSKLLDTGHGNILSTEFVEWRREQQRRLARQVAQMLA